MSADRNAMGPFSSFYANKPPNPHDQGIAPLDPSIKQNRFWWLNREERDPMDKLKPLPGSLMRGGATAEPQGGMGGGGKA